MGIVGECNIQYALDPHSLDYCIIEVKKKQRFLWRVVLFLFGSENNEENEREDNTVPTRCNDLFFGVLLSMDTNEVDICHALFDTFVAAMLSSLHWPTLCHGSCLLH